MTAVLLALTLIAAAILAWFLSELKARNAVLEAEKRSSEQAAAQMRQEFENLAHRIFDEKSRSFQTMSQQGLEALLKPVKERFTEFQGQVERLGKEETAHFTSLRGQIESVVKMSTSLSDSANNLADALKGESKTRGNWGELILERILESSGLREGVEYVREGRGMDIKGENGNTLKPDVIVKLPEDKHILVDSKLTLTSYEQYWNCEDDVQRKAHLKTFLSAVYLHIDQLAAKHYAKAKNLEAPDFILLFMPIEGAFGLAMQADEALWPAAWDKNVMIVGPSTLLPSLRTVASIWRHERQNKNVQEIARQAGALYDKFVGMLEDIDSAAKQMGQAQKSLDDVRNKIRDGKGSLTSRVEKLKELGAKTDKQLSKDYLQDDAPAPTTPAAPLN